MSKWRFTQQVCAGKLSTFVTQNEIITTRRFSSRNKFRRLAFCGKAWKEMHKKVNSPLRSGHPEGVGMRRGENPVEKLTGLKRARFVQ